MFSPGEPYRDSLEEQLEILKRDSSDYVLEIRVGDQTVQGEEFREKLELSSSNFTIQELDGKLRFLCKGAGHGLGMSQYGANVMPGRENPTGTSFCITSRRELWDACRDFHNPVYKFHQSGNSMNVREALLFAERRWRL